jgi:hypothetical protein
LMKPSQADPDTPQVMAVAEAAKRARMATENCTNGASSVLAELK